MFNTYNPYSQGYPISSYSQIASQMNNYTQTQQPQINTAQSNITFVNGIEGAKAFQLSPNSNVLLMDSDNQRFYVKSTDNLGIAKMSSYKFEELDFSNTQQEVTNTETIDSKDYNDILERIEQLDGKVTELSEKINKILE
jgi:hypothetical protein